ncbi:WAT1-related protein At2g37460-like [Cannabis sativa]|uniref:WAT1-related protein At2g37460-like n=1 Tax=Cannabis sativa TaxID=3483 RepID=UPI0029CA4633|nr:WAT1-related protein At2g37460-like [Cannabis sativa]
MMMSSSDGKTLFEKAKPFLGVVFLQFGFAGMDVLSKAALNQGMSNYVLVVYRHAVATIIIAPFAIFLDKKVRPKMTLPIFIKLVALSLLEPVIDQNLYFMGMKYTTATFAAAMTNILPAITFVLACILGLEKLNIKSIRTQAKVVGTVATVAGAMVMTLMKGPILHLFWTKATTSGGHHGQGGGGISLANSIKGSLMITIGCFSWACFMVLQAITLKTYPAELSLTAWICLLGTLEGTAVALVMERGNSSVWAIQWDTKLMAAVYSGVVCSGLAYYIQGIIMKDRGPVFVTAFSPLCMVIVAILGAFILAEQMFLGRVIGAAIIIIGLYLVVWGKSKDYKSTTKETLIDDQKQISSEIICSGKDNSHNLQIITVSKSEEGTEQTITTK